jgi:hypothetical protein
MVSADDRILYDDEDGATSVVSAGRAAIGLAVVATVVGIFLGYGFLGFIESVLVSELGERSPSVVRGFDASSSDFRACDGTGQARPDFSIVVAGAPAADGRQVGSRVVQFVVVDGIDELRPEPDVQAQSLCTLP